MALFSVGALALWWAESTGWTIESFRLFFLCGAVLNVSWLALGTVYLLWGKAIGNHVRTWLIAGSGFAVGVVFASSARTTIDPAEFPIGREVFGPGPRILAAIGSGVPAMLIIVGALWSSWRVMRRNSPTYSTPTQSSSHSRIVLSPGRLAIGNVVIAVGTLILSASGLIAGRLGQDRAFAITLLVGVSALFGGFLIASNPTRQQSMQFAPQHLAGTANG